MEDFLRRRAVSLITALCGQTQVALQPPNITRTEVRSPRKSAVLRPPGKSDVLTAAKNNDTSAETYGEPQTPADPR
jgi:hypothetical protein